MKYLCMEQDHDLFGRDRWEPIACRYAGSPAAQTPGIGRVMSVLELPTHHWNLRPGAPKALREAAIAHYAKFLAETREANPGVSIMQWQITCYWTHHWSQLTEAQRQVVVDHWCYVCVATDVDAICTAWYDAVANATPEAGDPQLGYELAIGDGKLSLARRVADKLGKPAYVAVWPRQRGIGLAAAIGGRHLTRAETVPMAKAIALHGMDGVIVWHGDPSHAATQCNPVEVAKLEAKFPGAVAATREQWGPETFPPGEEPRWDLETLPRILRAARRNRLAFADTLVDVIGGAPT